MEFDLENPLTSGEDEQQRRDSISDLFAAESDHMISTVGTIDLHARRNAESLILQVKLDIEAKKAIFFSHPFPSLCSTVVFISVGRRSSTTVWIPSSHTSQ